MKLTEIETIGGVEFPYSAAEKRLLLASPAGTFDSTFDLFYAEQGNIRTLILTDHNKKIAALTSFVVRINGKVWQAKNAVTYKPYKGQKLAGRLYKYVKETLGKSIQSDIEQSMSGKTLWTKTLPSLGLKPMMFDTKTERILEPDITMMYPHDSSPDIHRYMWIIERNDHYPLQNLLAEDSLLMPYTGLWYNPTRRDNV